MRRRHQDDGRDLVALFCHRHQWRRCTPLLAGAKSVEKTQDQAMLSLAIQKKRLNALKELSSI
jgi:hypothetical protein